MMPELELYNRLYEAAEVLGYQVWDHLPQENEPAPYPFVVIDDVQSTGAPYKDVIEGTYTVTLHVWAGGEDRLVVSEMMAGLSRLGRGLLLTPHYRFRGVVGRLSQQILTDLSVPDTVLKHGVLSMDFAEM